MVESEELGKQDVIDMAESAGNPVEADIDEHISWVAPAINDILEDNPMLTYTAADVYLACKQGAATLWVTKDGMVVTTGETDIFTGRRTMLIWVAWAWKRGMNLVAVHQEFFRRQARDLGFVKMEVRSAVPELKDYILSQGWELDTIVYTRDV